MHGSTCMTSKTAHCRSFRVDLSKLLPILYNQAYGYFPWLHDYSPFDIVFDVFSTYLRCRRCTLGPPDGKRPMASGIIAGVFESNMAFATFPLFVACYLLTHLRKLGMFQVLGNSIILLFRGWCAPLSEIQMILTASLIFSITKNN